MLKVSGLKVAYGGIQAVKGVNFEVRKGELVSLIGANGAGKTTTLKAVTGIQPIAALRQVRQPLGECRLATAVPVQQVDDWEPALRIARVTWGQIDEHLPVR